MRILFALILSLAIPAAAHAVECAGNRSYDTAVAGGCTTITGTLRIENTSACSGIKRVLGLWSWRGRGFQRGWLSKFAAGAEDDGYLITFTSDVPNDRSECVILSAADPGAGPIAKIRLPERISSGTHAFWAAASAL